MRIFNEKDPDRCRIDGGSIKVLRVVSKGWLVQCETCHGLQTITDEELASIAPKWRVRVQLVSGLRVEREVRSRREGRRFVRAGFPREDVESVVYERIGELV